MEISSKGQAITLRRGKAGVFYGDHLFFKGNRRGISRRQQAIGFLLTVNEGGEGYSTPGDK